MTSIDVEPQNSFAPQFDVITNSRSGEIDSSLYLVKPRRFILTARSFAGERDRRRRDEEGER
jgi:hypothetical protein